MICAWEDLPYETNLPVSGLEINRKDPHDFYLTNPEWTPRNAVSMLWQTKAFFAIIYFSSSKTQHKTLNIELLI